MYGSRLYFHMFFFCTKDWSNESEKSWGMWSHSKSHKVLLERLLVGGSHTTQLHPAKHCQSHPHNFSHISLPFNCSFKNSYFWVSCFLRVFLLHFRFLFFFSVYGFNTFVRMSSMNWRAPAVFLLHVLMWQCLKINGIYISIYLKIHQQPLPPTIKYHSMYSRFFFWQASTPLLNFPWPPVKKLNIDLETFTREKTARNVGRPSRYEHHHCCGHWWFGGLCLAYDHVEDPWWCIYFDLWLLTPQLFCSKCFKHTKNKIYINFAYVEKQEVTVGASSLYRPLGL